MLVWLLFALVLLCRHEVLALRPLEVSQLIEDSPNKTAAFEYWREVSDINQELLLFDGEEPLTLPDYSDVGMAYPPPLNPSQRLQLRMFASIAAAAYCMSRNLWPDWKCGSPRCSDPAITLRKLTEYSAEFGNDSVWFGRIINQNSSDLDVLKQTRIHRYVESTKSRMVGYVAENDVLDNLSFDPETFTADDKKTIVISFRGSLHPKNFVYDLNIAELDLKYPGSPEKVRVHSGFWLIWKSLEQQVVQAVEEIVKNYMLVERDGHHFDVWVSGHSLGGSVSIICAIELQRLILQNKFPGLETMSNYSVPYVKGHRWYLADGKISIGFRVYSYGQPRTGNTDFANWVTNLPAIQLFRTTFYNDLIVHLPPRDVKLPFLDKARFFHHASEFHIKSNHEITIPCDSSDDDPVSFDRSSGQYIFKSKHVKNTVQSLENPMCSNGVLSWNLISHLTYWDIIFGPWC